MSKRRERPHISVLIDSILVNKLNLNTLYNSRKRIDRVATVSCDTSFLGNCTRINKFFFSVSPVSGGQSRSVGRHLFVRHREWVCRSLVFIQFLLHIPT